MTNYQRHNYGQTVPQMPQQSPMQQPAVPQAPAMQRPKQPAQPPHPPMQQLQRPQMVSSGQFKLPLIPSVAPRIYLPRGTSLVVEGGGMRGFYGAGVLDAFMDAGLMFPYIAAVSAGSANVLSYISGQRGRNRLVVEHLVNDSRYMSMRNFIKKGSYFDFDFIFKTVPQEYLFFDHQSFARTQTRLLTGALDCRKGRTIWYEKAWLEPDFMPTIASCSIPLLSQVVRYDERDLLDGGILDPIPIEKSIADRNHFHVVILTQDASYHKTATKLGPLFMMAYHRRFPHLCWALEERHNAYNRQVARAEQLEREGRALIIRPREPLHISRVESNPQKLLPLYDQGHADGTTAVVRLRQLFRLPY